MIKKAYQQETECEEGGVSPREVGHNIYILALQVDQCIIMPHFVYITKTLKSNCEIKLFIYELFNITLAGSCKDHKVSMLLFLQLARHNKSLLTLLKPQKKTKEEEEESISSMVTYELYFL